MTVALKQNVPGYIDEMGRFRPIRSASFVGSGSSRRKAKGKDKKKYSKAKAGDLGKLKQERALEDPFDTAIRLGREEREAQKKFEKKLQSEIEREMLGEADKTSRGKARSLAQYVRAKGGIRPSGRKLGDLANLAESSRGLVSKTRKGLHADDMMQSAQESGYPVYSIDDLMEGLDNEVRLGKPVLQTRGFKDFVYNPSSHLSISELSKGSFAVMLRGFVLKKFKTRAMAEAYVASIKKRKKNPDILSTFATLAGGIASTMHINDMLEKRKTKAKKKTPAKRKNPRSTAKVEAKGGALYVLTISQGADTVGVYLHDGDYNGMKKFKTLTAARSYATRNKKKLVENPKENGILSSVKGSVKRALARSKAASELKKELRAEAKLERIRSRKAKALKAAKANPVNVKANPSFRATRSGVKYLSTRTHNGSILRLATAPDDLQDVSVADLNRMFRAKIARLKKDGLTNKQIAAALANDRWKVNPKKSAPVPRRRTYEMFQGREATTAKAMPVSQHAPARLDQLGDLVELKLNSGRVLKFPARKFRLCAANGKLWIAGGKFAKANPAGKANEINPIDVIDHVVYGTRKPHHGDHAYTHYIHRLGEESGHQPTLCVDKEGFPVIRGGKYKIEARGIVN